ARPANAGTPMPRQHHDHNELQLPYLIERTVIVIGTVDSGENPLPAGQPLFSAHRACAWPGDGGTCPVAAGWCRTGLPLVVPRLSETLPQCCPQTVRISERSPHQPVRACCLMRLVSSVTCV